MPYDKCGITAFVAVRVGFLKWLHFSLLLILKNWQQKVINSDKHFRVISGVIAGLEKVYPHFSVMPDDLVHAHGARSATGLFTQPIS